MLQNNDIFKEPKELKKWAIKLANACGGQQVSTTPILTKLNTQRIGELLDEFVMYHNQHTAEILNSLDKETEEE